MSSSNVIPPNHVPFPRVFSSGDILRVTSFREVEEACDITWLAVVIHCKPEPVTPWFAADGLLPRCKVQWIGGEDDDENFKRYHNAHPYNDTDRNTDYINPIDSRLHVQLYDPYDKVKSNGQETQEETQEEIQEEIQVL